MSRARRAATLEVRERRQLVIALPKHREHAPGAPAPGARKRHLRLVPPPAQPPSEESRRVRETRWTAALLAVASLALIVLWAAAMQGATDEAWWGPLLAVVLAAVVGFGLLVIRKTR
jgi:hypothetical protein